MIALFKKYEVPFLAEALMFAMMKLYGAPTQIACEGGAALLIAARLIFMWVEAT